MPVHDQDGGEMPLQKGDILFYNTEKRWPGGFGPSAANKKRAFDNWLIRFLQNSPLTHTAIVVEVSDSDIKIVDIVADRAVNIHSIREGDYRLEGTVFRPKGDLASDVCDNIAKIAKAHCGDDNIGFGFSRPKTWSTIRAMFCCMPFVPRPWSEKGYAEYILNDIYEKRMSPCFGQDRDVFPTYCSEFSGILLTLAIKETLESRHLLMKYDDWLHRFAACLKLTTTSDLHTELDELSTGAPVQFDTFSWQNEHCVKEEMRAADESTALTTGISLS